MRRKRPDPALLRHLKRANPVVQQAAIEAGEFLKRKLGKFRNLREKADFTLVTEADRGAEKIIIRALKKHFPTDHIVAEESGMSTGQEGSPFRWHIDPLDGTTNFVHAFPWFCTSIGLEFGGFDSGEPNSLVLGVIHQPIYNQTYTAIRGMGAHCNGKRMRVSKIATARDALLTTGFGYKKQYFDPEMKMLNRAAASTRALRRTGSAALDLCYVATGHFDGFWEWGLSTWDVAAGIILLQEAGGMVTQINGEPYHLGDTGILATNGVVHEQMVELLAGT